MNYEFGSTKLFDIGCKFIGPSTTICFDTANCAAVDASTKQNKIPVHYICGDFIQFIIYNL